MNVYTARVVSDALGIGHSSLHTLYIRDGWSRPPLAGRTDMWHEAIVIQYVAGMKLWPRKDGTRRPVYTGPQMRKQLQRERARVLSAKFTEEVTGHKRSTRSRRQKNQKRIDEQHRKDAHHDHDD